MYTAGWGTSTAGHWTGEEDTVGLRDRLAPDEARRRLKKKEEKSHFELAYSLWGIPMLKYIGDKGNVSGVKEIFVVTGWDRAADIK